MSYQDDLRSLAPKGVLRAAINTGNRALVQRDGDRLSGVSPALAKRLAAEIDAQVQLVTYEGAGKVFADAGQNTWDIGFLAVDAMRAEKIAFTQPYIRIEATLAVRAGSDISSVPDADRPGTTILTSVGSAYDMYLTEHLKHAQLERFGTPPESFAAFRAGRCDAVAGVRASLEAALGADTDVTILPDVLTAVHQSMVLPRKDDPRIAALDDFVARAVADGFVAAHL